MTAQNRRPRAFLPFHLCDTPCFLHFRAQITFPYFSVGARANQCLGRPRASTEHIWGILHTLCVCTIFAVHIFIPQVNTVHVGTVSLNYPSRPDFQFPYQKRIFPNEPFCFAVKIIEVSVCWLTWIFVELWCFLYSLTAHFKKCEWAYDDQVRDRIGPAQGKYCRCQQDMYRMWTDCYRNKLVVYQDGVPSVALYRSNGLWFPYHYIQHRWHSTAVVPKPRWSHFEGCTRSNASWNLPSTFCEV